MLKRVSLALAGLGLAAGTVLAGASGASAQALTPGGPHRTDLSCTSGGSKFNMSVYYTASVVSTVDGRQVQELQYRSHDWSSSPAAQFDRVTLSSSYDGTNYLLAWAMGGTSSTQNDVPSSGSSSAEFNPPGTETTHRWPTIQTMKFRMSVYGGVGNSTATCASTATVQN